MPSHISKRGRVRRGEIPWLRILEISRSSCRKGERVGDCYVNAGEVNAIELLIGKTLCYAFIVP